jgi:peptidylprolyl isomerase
MTKGAKTGDTVMLHYIGRFEDGRVFDSSAEKDPIPVEIGAGKIIKGLEKAMLGMQTGEKKTVTVKPEEGYGNYNENLLIEMPKKRIPENISPEKGMLLQLVDKNGLKLPVIVNEILDESIRLDANHPLAGKVLVFDIEVVKIV